MATVKEVQLMDGEDQVTPYTLIDSVWDTDGKKYMNKIYTKTEINEKIKALQNAIDEINKML